MKKFLCMVMATAVLTAGLMSGCSSPAESDKAFDMDATVKEIFDAAGFTDELMEQDDTVIGNSYPTLDLSKVEKYSVYISATMSTPEEAAVFQAKSKGDLGDIRAAVEKRIADQKASYEDYRPEEMPKLENAVVVEKGTALIYVVCPNYDAVSELLG